MKNDHLGDLCNKINQIQADREKRRWQERWEKIKNWLGLGAAGMGVGALVLLGCLAICVLLVIAPMLLATLIYFGWNLAIVTIFGMAPITFFWQSIGLAFCVMVASAIFKSLFTVTVKK